MPGHKPHEIPPPRLVELSEDGSAAIPAEPARRRLPPGLPGGVAGALLIAAVAGMVGFAFGSRGSDERRTAAPSSATSYTDSTGGSGSALPTAGTCSLQIGHRLQLGVEVQNSGTAEMIVRSVTPHFPLAGLRAVRTEAGACGQQSRAQVANNRITPGGSLWVTTTVDVLVACPTPLPVQFEVVFTNDGNTFRLPMGGFADLGGVPYTGCG
jgi:hypothetical protein